MLLLMFANLAPDDVILAVSEDDISDMVDVLCDAPYSDTDAG